MEKAGIKCRIIRIKSKKSEKIILLHTSSQKKYALALEGREEVKSYETLLPLDRNVYPSLSRLYIRKEYFEIGWTTDFLLHFSDGSAAVRELVKVAEISKKSTLEKLELSRRYWANKGILDWKVVVVEL